MRGQWRNFVLIAFVLVLATVGCSASAPQASVAFPTGTFSAIDNTIGEFVLDAKADGTFTISLSNGTDQTAGSYTVVQNQITFKSGPCAGADKETGTYTWKLDGNKLLFNAVKEVLNFVKSLNLRKSSSLL